MAPRVLLPGERIGHSCTNDVYILLGEGGFERSWKLDDGPVVDDSGWTLDEARKQLKGEVGCLYDSHGCAYRFSLQAWRDVPPAAWRVLAVYALGGGLPNEFREWETLSEIRARFGGEQGTAVDPAGRPHSVSLRPWADLPSATRLLLCFGKQDVSTWKWWQRIRMRLLLDAVEWDKAKGERPSPRQWDPTRHRKLPKPTVTTLRFNMTPRGERNDADET